MGSRLRGGHRVIWFSEPLRADLYPRCGHPLRLARERPGNKAGRFACSQHVWYAACNRSVLLNPNFLRTMMEGEPTERQIDWGVREV